jgi:hypothetical protein
VRRRACARKQRRATSSGCPRHQIPAVPRRTPKSFRITERWIGPPSCARNAPWRVRSPLSLANPSRTDRPSARPLEPQVDDHAARALRGDRVDVRRILHPVIAPEGRHDTHRRSAQSLGRKRFAVCGDSLDQRIRQPQRRPCNRL